MKINKTLQGNYILFIWDIGREVPQGIEIKYIIITKQELNNLREFLINFKE